MSSSHLRKRSNFQKASGEKAGKAESIFFEAFKKHFDQTDFTVRPKPNEFCSIYVNVKLTDEEKNKIYNPKQPVKRHGITPDFAIENGKTGKILYVEVKRQDGWVEGKKRSAGRGNAHERSCKFFTPGLLKVLREKGGIAHAALPFWTVFVGEITRDPCRVREVTCWFDNYSNHFFMWRDVSDPKLLTDHFENKLKALLETDDLVKG